jgi:hypothetical protein
MPNYKVFYVKREHFSGWRVDPVPVVAHYESVTAFQAASLHDVFREMNVVDGTERPVALRQRSMSVGDVVLDLDTGKGFIVASFGFDELTPDVVGAFALI